jgi:chromodomain-helicase-DNA-binding protein 7
MTKSATGDQSNKALSSKEIENLLKKGAYHAFLEADYKTAEITEQDIDAILANSSRLLQYEHGEGEDGSSSSFAKASFVTHNGEDIDLDDPSFWYPIYPPLPTLQTLLTY